MLKKSLVIVGFARTPLGDFLGSLKDLSATQLGSFAVKAALERSQLNPADVNEVYMGCVLPAGLGQAPARQAAVGAGIPFHTSCTTINKVCGSGMKSVMLACDTIIAEHANIIVAGGMESMSNAPYLLPKARQGYRLGHGAVIDHMFFDGLEDAYEKGRLMGTFAEDCAKQYHFDRASQDAFATTSLKRAQKAIQDGSFESEITPITATTKQGQVIVKTDDHPLSVKLEKIPQLKPAFDPQGTITAANSSSIADGAAALIIMTEEEAQKRHLKPLAKIIDYTTHSQKPSLFTTAPIKAIETLLQKTGWKKEDVDLFEINEAFAVVAMAAIHDLKLDPEKVNIHGGACALGHPIGASGARLLVTLISALKQRQLKRGIATLCIGGGEATAMAVEII